MYKYKVSLKTMRSLCAPMLTMPLRFRKALARHFVFYDLDTLRGVVRVVGDTVRAGSASCAESHLWPCVVLLDVLHAAAMRSELLTPEEFQVPALNLKSGRDQMCQRYLAWLGNKPYVMSVVKDRRFCEFDFPFLLNMSTKGLLLRAETRAEREREMTMQLLQSLFTGSPPVLHITVRRDHIVNDATDTVSSILNSASLSQLRKPLRVSFHGEEGVDAGGVRKEFFQLIVRQIFNPEYGMFKLDEDTQTFWFNAPHPAIPTSHYTLIGAVIGMALYNDVILDLHFPRVVYKKLLGQAVTFDDLAITFPSVARGLRSMLTLSAEELREMDQRFEITQEDVFGCATTVDLIPNGKDEVVTPASCERFCNLYAKHVLTDAIDETFGAFRRGFDAVVKSKAIRLCQPSELERLICGNPVLDFEALRMNATYVGWDGFDEPSEALPNNPTINRFWEVFNSMDVEQKKRLLFFVTGTDRAPVDGLGTVKFVVQMGGTNTDVLPTSHTCFNTLILPCYSSTEQLREKLLIAIENSEGFGLR